MATDQHTWNVWRISVIVSMAVALAGLIVGSVALYGFTHGTVNFQTNLQREHVCAKTNQGQACRDLFDRLVSNVSVRQRIELACLIARDLERPDLSDKINCTRLPRR